MPKWIVEALAATVPWWWLPIVAVVAACFAVAIYAVIVASSRDWGRE